MFTSFKKLFLAITLCFLTLFAYSKSHYYYYYNVNVPTGFSLAGSSVDPYLGGISYMFPTSNIPDGLMIYKLWTTPSGYQTWTVYVYDKLFGGWTYDPSDTNSIIKHGEGYYIYNPSAPFETFFVGNVVQSTVTPINKGFNLISPKTLKSGGITTVHGISPNDGDMVYKRVGNNWSIYTYEDGPEPVWVPNEPSISKNEGFYYNTSTPFNWVQYDQLPNVYNTITNRFMFAFYSVEVNPRNLFYFGGTTKANTEGTIKADYSETLTNPNWWHIATYGPAIQPIDNNYFFAWPALIGTKSGYLRVSTY